MNRSILFQVTAPAILTGVVLIGVCFGSAWSIHRLQTNLALILSDNVMSVEASLDLENALRQARYHSLLYLVHPRDATLKQIEQDERAFEDALDRALESANTPDEEALLDRIEGGYEQYREEMERLRSEVARTGPRQDFVELARTHPIRHITNPCQELGRMNRRQLQSNAADSNELSRKTWRVLLLLGLGGPIGGLIAGFGMSRGLSRSITRLSFRVRDVVDRLDTARARGLGDSASTPATSPDAEAAPASGTIHLTVKADGDLGTLDRQLQHVLRRVEEVTERCQRQQRDILRAEQLAAVGQLAAGVAHEVRNPLTGIKLLVEAALRPRRDGAPFLSEEDLCVIRDEITRLEGIVQHFLDFARPPAPQLQPVDLRDLAQRPLDLIRGRARQQRVTVEVALPEATVPVRADPGQVHTVVANLLFNALDAMPRGGRLRLAVAPAEGGMARLEVADTGPGISPELSGRLFTPFATTKPTGTGLGLSLSRRIVEEHGGRIAACGAPESGACFVVELPAAAVSTSEAPLPPLRGRGEQDRRTEAGL
jgi:signal transduction histidine kinase